MKPLKYFSLFSGYGGFEKGIQQAYESIKPKKLQRKKLCNRRNSDSIKSTIGKQSNTCIGFSEINKYAISVYKKHFPKHKNYGDITKIQWNKVPDFDLLTGGSPCQDFSIAGKREGIKGERSGLIWEFIRALREKKPKYFIWENVRGVLSSNNGKDFECICEEFCKSGYAIDFEILNAKNFGVPQNRQRVFVIGKRIDLLESSYVI